MSRKPAVPRANRIHSSPRDQILSRGPRVVPPAWRQQHQEQVIKAHETRVSIPSTSHKRLEPLVTRQRLGSPETDALLSTGNLVVPFW